MTGRLPSHLRPPPSEVYRSFQSIGRSPQAGRAGATASTRLRVKSVAARASAAAWTRAESRANQPALGSPPGHEAPLSGRRPATARIRKSSPKHPWSAINPTRGDCCHGGKKP